MLTLSITSKCHSNVVVVTVREAKDHEVGSEVAEKAKVPAQTVDSSVVLGVHR